MTKMNPDKGMSADLVRSLFRLDETTGHLFWHERGFGRQINKPVGCLMGGGYRKVARRVDGEYLQYFAHHIVWTIVHGSWPTTWLDHKNGNKDDNRPENLRKSTYAQNRVNSRKQSENASGLKWVSLHKESAARNKKKKWQASVWLGETRKQRYFEDKNAAYQWASSVAKELHGAFYHPGT